MYMDLNEEQEAVRSMVAEFTANEIAPFAGAWDATGTFPIDVFRHAASLGLAAIYCRDDVGGSGLSRLDAAVIFEEMATACPSTAAYLSIHNMCAWMIDAFGTADQRQAWVPRLAAMNAFTSYCLTEPGNGSDAGNLKTRAVRDGDHYVLTGEKAFISGAGVSDLYVVMARTGDAPGPAGISAILVEKDTPGFGVGSQERKMGWRNQPTATVLFQDCRVPVANRLGAEGDGFKIAMKGLDGGRVNIGACSLGGARGALDAAVAYTKDRRQFGRPIADFQATQFRVADMATELEAARLLVHQAARCLDAGHPDATLRCAMAKRLATDLGFAIVDSALQLHGGYGYIQDYPVERLLRDLRVHRILEGTNEIMRVIIARKVLAD